MYDNSANRYYFKIPNVDTLYFVDCSIETDEYTIRKTDKKERLIGYNCSSIELTGGGRKHTIFYAPQLYLNPKHLSRSVYHGNNLVAAESESVYLKWITEEESVTSIMSAFKVESKRIDNNTFLLPVLPAKQVN